MTNEPTAGELLEPEIAPQGALVSHLRRPGVPVTVDELAVLRGEAVAIIEARVQVLDTARMAAIASTHPEDWVLFKSPDERVTGYLQDSGCERVRPIFSIQVFDIETPERVVSADGKSYAIITRGRGRCGLTLDSVDGAEGIRESTEDFCAGLVGIKQELRVRQASRANLDGRIVRELAGLGSVPIEVLALAWKGTDKKTDHCRKGRGFGTKEERHGGERADAPQLVPPKCAVCGATGVLRSSSRGGFYGCPDYKKHEGQKWTIDVEKWKQDPRSQKPADAPAQQPQSAADDARDEAQREREREELRRADAEAERQTSTTRRPPANDGPPLTDADIPFGSNNPRDYNPGGPRSGRR